MKKDGQIKLFVQPCELKEANEFIAKHHRHHKPVQGHRFSVACVDAEGVVRGVATVGRPVARHGGHPKEVLEVTRLATDGTQNACSFLYAAVWRIGAALGYKKVQTYILQEEPGSSLKGAGFQMELALAGGGQWKHTDGKPRRTDQPTGYKQRWAKKINP